MKRERKESLAVSASVFLLVCIVTLAAVVVAGIYGLGLHL